MQTQRRELPVPALAAGLAVLGGVAAWQLGMEFERAWLRSCDGPLPGDTLGGYRDEAPLRALPDQGSAAIGERRRWVARQRPRTAPGAARLA